MPMAPSKVVHRFTSAAHSTATDPSSYDIEAVTDKLAHKPRTHVLEYWVSKRRTRGRPVGALSVITRQTKNQINFRIPLRCYGKSWQLHIDASIGNSELKMAWTWSTEPSSSISPKNWEKSSATRTPFDEIVGGLPERGERREHAATVTPTPTYLTPWRC